MDIEQALEVLTHKNGFVEHTEHELKPDGGYGGYSSYMLGTNEVEAIHTLIKAFRSKVGVVQSGIVEFKYCGDVWVLNNKGSCVTIASGIGDIVNKF